LDEATVQSKLRQARVARLATLDAHGQPHLVPVCFAYDGRAVYSPIDRKPKRVGAEQLARVRHIQARPAVALLVDEYQEDWRQLWYIMIRGTATLISPAQRDEHARACRLLKEKYAQYQQGMLSEEALLIRILPEQILSWGQP
jgi:PPOX class probable F420-dependent enzyme